AYGKPAGGEIAVRIRVVAAVLRVKPAVPVVEAVGVKIARLYVHRVPAVPQQGAVCLDIVPVGVLISSAVYSAYGQPSRIGPCAVLVHIVALVLQVEESPPWRISAAVEIILSSA